MCLGALLATGLAGCGSTAQEAAVTAEPAPRADCLAPQVIADLGLHADDGTGTAHPDVPDAGAVPPEFQPASAVQCLTGERLTDSDGVWAAVTVRRLEGDLGPLLAALSEPTEPVDADQACAADLPPRWELWLVDALGRAVRVERPVDACGVPTAAVTSAVDALDTVEEEHFPVDLLAARVRTTPAP